MTDIYLRKPRSSKKPVVIALGILAALALIFAWSRRTEKPEPAPEQAGEEEPIQIRVVEDIAPKIEEPQPEAPGQTRDPGLRLVAEAKNARDAGDLREARALGFRILEESSHPIARRDAEMLLGEVNIALATSRRQMAEKVDYTIQSGDTLAELAKKFNTTVDLIRMGNSVSGHIIRVSDRYRILQGEFSVAIDKSENSLVVFLNGRFFKRYRVGTGKFERTPEGDFKITLKQAQPTWWRPDGKAVPYKHPDNVLGTHWLSLDIPGYGIHGTWEPESIGKQASEGCVRLLNEDVAELYTLLPEGTKVTITN